MSAFTIYVEYNNSGRRVDKSTVVCLSIESAIEYLTRVGRTMREQRELARETESWEDTINRVYPKATAIERCLLWLREHDDESGEYKFVGEEKVCEVIDESKECERVLGELKYRWMAYGGDVNEDGGKTIYIEKIPLITSSGAYIKSARA